MLLQDGTALHFKVKESHGSSEIKDNKIRILGKLKQHYVQCRKRGRIF